MVTKMNSVHILNRVCVFLTFIILCCGCASSYAGRYNLNSVVWMQSSEEYRALSHAAYNMARQNLDAALADKTWTALPSQVPADSAEAIKLAKLPPAVILDIDETVLSTLPYQAWIVKNEKPFTRTSWNAWVSEASAKPMPGALGFVRYAKEKGITLFYLTNRRYRGALDENANGQIEPGEAHVDLKPFTIANLVKHGFLPQKNVSNENSVILRGETYKDGKVKSGWDSSDKSARREFLSSDYRILLIIGDDLNDFISYPKQQAGERSNISSALDQHRARWGHSWFMLPNPVYGYWESRRYDLKRTLTAEEKIKLKLDRLNTWQ